MNATTATFLTFAAFLLMIMYHEYGHAWAATSLGLTVKGVKAGNSLTGAYLKMFGVDRKFGLPAARFRLGGIDHEVGILPGWGSCSIEGLDMASNRTRFLVAAAGPASSLLMAGAFYLAGQASGCEPLSLLAVACLEFALLNLLPIPCLDGGVMLKAAWPKLKKALMER